MEACSSCHDDLSFEATAPPGMVAHPGDVQVDNSKCSVCHPTTGSVAGLAEMHVPTFSNPNREIATVELLSIRNTAPGETPTVSLRVSVDGTPRDILTSPLNRLRISVAGPNSDFVNFAQYDITSAGTLVATNAAAGEFDYTLPSAMAVDAQGSYTVAAEGRLAAGNPFFAPTLAFAVTDAQAVPRREVVTADRCNNCHYELALHGGGRTNANYCVTCHNPGQVNDDRWSNREGVTYMIESADLKVMAHKIHAGENLSQPYFLGGFPVANAGNPDGNMINFGHTRYPRALNDCTACHKDGTWRLPLTGDRLPTVLYVRSCAETPTDDADDYCNNPVVDEEIHLQPETAVCTSCHDSAYTMAHAEVMTTSMGVESCATCHGPGSVADVDVVHGLD